VSAVKIAMVSVDDRHEYVAELSTAVARSGHRVTMYVGAGREPGVGRGVTVVELPLDAASSGEPFAHLNGFAQRLAERVRADRPDVLHSHDWMAGTVATLAGRTHRVPVTHTCHGLGSHTRRQGDPDRATVERAVARVAAGVVVTSSAGRFELARMGVPRDKTSIIPPGVDVARFSPDGPRATRRSPLRRMLSVCGAGVSSGCGDLIAALPAIPDTELIVIGGPSRDRLAGDPGARWLREQAAARGVADRLALTGQVDREHLPALLRSADRFACVPWEGLFDAAAVEAMACGVPVLATAVGGLADIVVGEITGALVPSRQPRAIATTARRLLHDPAWLEAMGAAACDRAQVRYSWSRIAHDTIRTYLPGLGLADTDESAGDEPR
jgi:glycosyltransferase involved in cell wall biosynthesis